MTEQDRRKAEESWTYYRRAFARRSRPFPALAILVSLIDRIHACGFSEQLYAGASLDNLVISVLPNPRDRRQTILVIPQEDAVEFRLYPKGGDAEVTTVARDQAEAALDGLLSRLVAGAETAKGGVAESESEA
jgi:hypothetical protein